MYGHKMCVVLLTSKERTFKVRLHFTNTLNNVASISNIDVEVPTLPKIALRSKSLFCIPLSLIHI